MATNSPHRYGDTVLSSSDSFFSGTDRGDRAVLDPTVRGGQYGWAPNSLEYVSEHLHLDQQGWCFLLSSPEVFDRFTFGKYLHSLTKSMFETRAMQWQGPTEKHDFNYAEVKVGGRTLSLPNGSTRSLGPFSIQLKDVMGEPYTSLIRIWGLWLQNDVDLGYPRMVLLSNLQNDDMLVDKRSASVVVFNTTENVRDISHAALILGMFPRSTVEIGIRRNKDEEAPTRDINMEFTGLIEFDTLYVRDIARKFLTKIPIFNPDARKADSNFLEPTATVQSLKDVGIIEQMTREKAKVDNEYYFA